MTAYTRYTCEGGHDNDGSEWNCPYCTGDLFHCTVCNGFEGSLTTECSGEKMSAEQGDDVYAGKIDFKDGKWVEAKAPHTPHGHVKKEG